MDLEIMQGDVLERLADLKARGVKVRACVTSPPYWGLRDYGTGQWRGGDADCDHNPQRPDGGDRADRALPLVRGGMYRDVCGKCGAVRVDNQIGLERTPDEYVAKLVQVFRAVRDVLADDGTLWLNLGDSYARAGGWSDNSGLDGLKRGESGRAKSNMQSGINGQRVPDGIKEKDLVGIPWRVAFALQADGWYLRSDIIWHKPNPMPESVRDRPTKAHEYIFLLSKSPKYFYDADAVAEPLKAESIKRNQSGWNGNEERDYVHGKQNNMSKYLGSESAKSATTRNRRSVWTVTTKPYRGAHFATFPPDLIEPCILAGTSAKGQCPKCGAAWERVVERTRLNRTELPESDPRHRPNTYKGAYSEINGKGDAGYTETKTLGWQPTCTCGVDPVPDLVLDPFGGSGTTAEVAIKHGRRAILIELNPQYVELQRARLAKVQRVMA